MSSLFQMLKRDCKAILTSFERVKCEFPNLTKTISSHVGKERYNFAHQVVTIFSGGVLQKFENFIFGENLSLLDTFSFSIGLYERKQRNSIEVLQKKPTYFRTNSKKI